MIPLIPNLSSNSFAMGIASIRAGEVVNFATADRFLVRAFSPYSQRKHIDARSPLFCNKPEVDGVEMRRVRKKSLYLGDLSDMNPAPDYITQSIVHVLDEWAKAAQDTTAMSTDWLSSGYCRKRLIVGFPPMWAVQTMLHSLMDRRQIGAGRLVVEANAHQRHLRDQPQPIVEAPRENLVVARRHQKAGSGKCGRRADQGLQVPVGLRHSVEVEADPCRVACDPAKMLHHAGAILPNRIG